MWDWDEMDIDIKERQHHVDFDPNLYLLKKEILALESKKDPQAQEALNALDNVQSAIDLGCGSGNSTKALVEICPKLFSIDMVDGKNVISPHTVAEVEEAGVNVETHPNIQIQEYLKEVAPSSKDLIFFGNVLNHDLGPEDIERMSEILHENGIVFETDQTSLNSLEMSKYFEKLYKSRVGIHRGDVIWKKRQSSQNS